MAASERPEPDAIDASSTSDRSDVAVEAALAKALTAAAAAGRFDVVAQLARELEARRADRAGNVVDLAARRRGAR